MYVEGKFLYGKMEFCISLNTGSGSAYVRNYNLMRTRSN